MSKLTTVKRPASQSAPKGNYSRRHATSTAHDKARAIYATATEARNLAVATRGERRSERTPQEQLAVLDGRLGVGVGAKKERARLQSLVNPS